MESVGLKVTDIALGEPMSLETCEGQGNAAKGCSVVGWHAKVSQVSALARLLFYVYLVCLPGLDFVTDD